MTWTPTKNSEQTNQMRKTKQTPKPEEKYPFKNQLEVGKVGEEFFLKLVRTRLQDEASICDVRNNVSFQGQDIDFLVANDTFEVKTDTTKTGNFFLEHEQNGKPGALWKSRAQWWFYYFSTLNRAFLIKLPDLQKYVWAMCRPQDLRGVAGGKAGGFVVPIDRLTQESFVREVFFDEQTETGGDSVREPSSRAGAESGVEG
jgi:hypothetical protein